MSDYIVPTQKSLERGYFWMTHRKLFFRIIFFIIFAIIFGIYAYAGFYFYKYFQNPSFEDQARAYITQNYWLERHKANSPQEIERLSTKSLQVNTDLYDLVALVSNGNEDWFATEVEYHFIVDGRSLPKKTSFFNPGETRFLYEPGYKSSRPISSIDVRIDKVTWMHNDGEGAIGEWFIPQENIKFKPVTREIDGNKSFTVPASVTWDVTNNSLYDFWEVTFQVALYNGESLVGIKEWKEGEFQAFDRRTLEVSWPNDLPRISEVKIYPVQNWLDKDNLMRLRGLDL